MEFPWHTAWCSQHVAWCHFPLQYFYFLCSKWPINQFWTLNFFHVKGGSPPGTTSRPPYYGNLFKIHKSTSINPDKLTTKCRRCVIASCRDIVPYMVCEWENLLAKMTSFNFFDNFLSVVDFPKGKNTFSRYPKVENSTLFF